MSPSITIYFKLDPSRISSGAESTLLIPSPIAELCIGEILLSALLLLRSCGSHCSSIIAWSGLSSMFCSMVAICLAKADLCVLLMSMDGRLDPW